VDVLPELNVAERSRGSNPDRDIRSRPGQQVADGNYRQAEQHDSRPDHQAPGRRIEQSGEDAHDHPVKHDDEEDREQDDGVVGGLESAVAAADAVVFPQTAKERIDHECSRRQRKSHEDACRRRLIEERARETRIGGRAHAIAEREKDGGPHSELQGRHVTPPVVGGAAPVRRDATV
jgi:hypothetical protein